MSEFDYDKSAELSAALRDDLPNCCPRRFRNSPSKKRRHRDSLARGGMAHLTLFNHLIPIEMEINEADDEKKRRVFATFYHFGAKLYDCLHTIAIELEDEECDGFSSKTISTVLKMLNFEHFLSYEKCRYPSVSNLLDIIEKRRLDDCQVLFKISDLLEDHKGEKPDRFGPYDPSDPKRVPLNHSADAITAVSTMAYCFLATSFAEELMNAAIHDIYASDDESESDLNELETPVSSKIEKKDRIINHRNLPSIEAKTLQQNAMLLLATRVGIEQFLELSHEIGLMEFQDVKLSRITPLMEAAASSSETVVRRLLELGADPNIPSVPNCNTALIYAASTDGRDVVREILMTKGAIKPDVYLINNYYHDAMMEVALVGGADTLKEFLDLDYKPKFQNIRQQERDSALTLSAQKGHIRVVTAIMDYYERNPPQTESEKQELCLERYSALMEAAMEGHIDVCKLMLSRGTPADLCSEVTIEPSPLIVASAGGYPEVVEVLLAAGAKIEELSNKKNTPLMEACAGDQGDQAGVVRLLLSKRADVNAVNPDSGDTPLSLATRNGYVEIMKILIDKGGDVTAGKTSPIVEAALGGHLECAQFLLAHCKSIPQDQLSRALVAAADFGCLGIVEELIRAGADLNYEQDERTALMNAAKGNHFEVVQLLVNKGASVNFKSSKNDATALSLACSEGHMAVAEFLIRNGADPMLKMDDGVNCFMEVARHGSFDLMSLLVEFTKGNLPLDKEPPKLGLTRCLKTGKKRKSEMGSDIMTMFNGIYPKRKGSKQLNLQDIPFPTHEIDMLTHLLKLQQQMVSYEAQKNTDGETTEISKALTAIESVYGYTNEGKINFPPPPNRQDMDKLYNGDLVPSIKLWAEQVSHGWLEMERRIGKPIELSSFQQCSEENSTYAAAAVSVVAAAAAAASGMDSQTYLASVFAKMNNGEEMPRVPATVGSLNAASAAMSGISFHSDDAMRLFGGASFATKFLPVNKKICNHQQYASIHHIQEGAFRAALIKMSSMHKERKGGALSICDMSTNFPIEKFEERIVPAVKSSPTGPKKTSLTVPKPTNDAATLEVTTEQPGVIKTGEKKEGLDPIKIYPGIMRLAADMEKMCRTNPTDANRDLAVTAAYIASTLPDDFCTEMNIETGDRILKRLLSGFSEKQKNAVMVRIKNSVNSEPGSEVLRRSLDHLPDKRAKEEYLKLFRDSADCAFYDKCVQEKNHLLKIIEQKKGKPIVGNTGSHNCSASKSLMAKTVQSQQQQQSQLRRTHSEGDGAERTKSRSNAIDKATETTLETPLTIACANGHKEIVELLLKEGANIEHRDKKGFSPLIISATAGHASVVEILLKNHAAIEAQSDRTKDTALSLACSGGRKEVVELLLAHGANKEHRNVSDYTPLSLASSGGYIEIVNMLLAAGSEINSRTGSKLGISPLMLAAMNGHKEATRVLLEKGSDINAQIETNRNTALTLASFQGRTDVVKLLLDYNANVEHRAKTGLTPLMECASGGYVDVGKLLIEAGADTNAAPVQQTKDTALTISAEKGHEAFVKMLLENDATVDTRNKKGCTALWLACNGGHLSTAKVLLDNGADADMFDNRKISPMMAAFRKGHVEIVKYMVSSAKQFPNEQDLDRAQQTAENEVIRKKCEECIEIIRDAKAAQATSAEEAAAKLLADIEEEKVQKDLKKQKQKDKKNKKKEAKKSKLESEKHEEPDQEPENEPSPELEPEAVLCQEPEITEPAPIVVEEPPKDPPKPRRNRRKTNPDGVPKGPKVHSEPKQPIEEEPAELPFEPIKVTIPPPAQVHAAIVSPESHSESEEWYKAGKEGKKAKNSRKVGAHGTPSSAGSSQAKESSTTSSVTSVPYYEIDTQNKKMFKLSMTNAVASRVIGKAGSNINAVREVTLATIEISKATDNGADRTVTVKGNPEAVRCAVNIISYMMNDADVIVTDAIRTVSRGNTSAASSLSSECTSKSAMDSTSYAPSIPLSFSSASITRQSSSPVQQPTQKFAKSNNHQKEGSGGNVWHQRMAAREEKTVETTRVVQKPIFNSSQPKLRQTHIRQQSSLDRQEPAVSASPVSMNTTQRAKYPVLDRVIAPPTRREPVVSAVVQPVQQLVCKESIAQQRLPDQIGQSLVEPIPRSSSAQDQAQQSMFSKAPGTRSTIDFSRAPGTTKTSQTPSTSIGNELFDQPLAFGQFKPITTTAASTSIASTSTLNGSRDDKNGNIDEFDFTKLRMFDDGKMGDIWGKADEGSSWGSLFNFLPRTSANSSLENPTNKSDSATEWGPNDFMSQLLTNTSLSTTTSSSQSTTTMSTPAQQPSSSSVNSGLASLEQKGWMPASYAPSARDPNRSQPPLFARSPSTSTANSSSSIQQQQQQQIQQQQQVLQQALQQQQRLQKQYQQQFQQPQHSQNSQQAGLNDATSSKFSIMQPQQQQIYNQIQSLGQDPHGVNVYNHLAAQLLTHQESSSIPAPSTNQLASNYYPSPSYTDASVLGQLNMSSLSQRGIKQFDGFSSDQPASDNVIAALLEQQQKQKKQVVPQAGYLHSSQPQSFGNSASNVANQQRLGVLQPRQQQQPPYVAPQVPPGFANIGNSPASSTTRSISQIYPPYGQNAQPQSYNQLPQQMDWNRLGQQHQSPSQQNQQPPSSSNKWSSNW